jgi:hypothetical protein
MTVGVDWFPTFEKRHSIIPREDQNLTPIQEQPNKKKKLIPTFKQHQMFP